MKDQRQRQSPDTGFEDPAFLRAALTDPRLAWLWLALRLVVGWYWLAAGWRELHQTTGAADALAIGQTIAGIALILGAFAGLAAFTGGLLQLLAPPLSGPVGALLFAAVVALVLAWKTAGWIGLDRWLLPVLGMPWRGGALLGAPRERVIEGSDIERNLELERNRR
jgi:thiosulfate dehydrogenase [quinone] large subunit